MNMDENGTISELDTEIMHKSILTVSRTNHYLQDKIHAFEVFTGAYFGEESWIHKDASLWAEWIDENFNDLQEIRASRDPDLAAKLEIAISDRYNRILRAAMLGVPDQSLFDTAIMEGILNGTHYLELPSAVQKVLDDQRKRRESPNSSTAQTSGTKRKRQGIVKVSHDNQPQELRISPDQYRAKVTPYLQEHKDKVPKFDQSTDECLKYAYLGYCNPDCPRAKAHSPVRRSTKRFDALSKLKSAFMQTNPSPRPDFQDGEAK